MQPLLTIDNLHASIEDKPILKGLSLTLYAGHVHAIMGPNGAGKSTLAKVLAGHPAYTITEGSILLGDKNLLEMEIEERAASGLFVGFQYPPEVPGVNNRLFLQQALNAQRKAQAKEALSDEEFETLLQEKRQWVEIPEEFAARGVNEGFSGGEKKRNEILQMALFDPIAAVLDETDSGLDIDAMRVVSHGIHRWMRPDKTLLLITHYQRLLDYVAPHSVHVMVDGKIVRSGEASLAKELEAQGYR